MVFFGYKGEGTLRYGHKHFILSGKYLFVYFHTSNTQSGRSSNDPQIYRKFYRAPSRNVTISHTISSLYHQLKHYKYGEPVFKQSSKINT